MGIALIVALPGAAARAGVPASFVETPVASGLSAPTAIAIAPDGRIFVAQQGGALRVVKNGALLATPFVSLTVDSSGERGLLGVAFDPGFAANQFVYAYHTVPGSPPHNRVTRFTANGDVAQAGSAQPILDLDNLSGATNHNGGAIHFGADGKLYVAVGENATPSNAQTLTNRLGKLLRINADGSIPTDNPFFNTTAPPNGSIWALGLRNPFTFAVQPGTGRIFVDDVGQNTTEEIDDGIAGANYGWPSCEGPCTPANASFRDPLYSYGHGIGATTGCAIAGGAFYNPPVVQFPADYVGDYLFADLCSGWVRRYDPVANTVTDFVTGLSSPVDLAVGGDGSLLELARGGGANTGTLVRVTYSPPTSVTVRRLSVTPTARGIRVSWVSARDPRLLRYDVYREHAGARLRINRAPVLAGRSRYMLLDRRAAGARYWLRASFADGTRTWFGPATS